MTEAELAAIAAAILPYRQSLPGGRWIPGEEQDDDGEYPLPYGRFNGALWSVDEHDAVDMLADGMSITFALYVLGMHEHIPALLAEVRRLRAALEQLRDGEVSEQPASPPEEPEPFLYCADCTAFAPVGMELEHKPMFTCGIAQAALAGAAPAGVAGGGEAMTAERIPAEVFHPGVFLAEELAARGWSQAELAQRMDNVRVSRNIVAGVLDGVYGISFALARGLALALGTSASFWLDLQTEWDVARLRARRARRGTETNALVAGDIAAREVAGDTQ